MSPGRLTRRQAMLVLGALVSALATGCVTGRARTAESPLPTAPPAGQAPISGPRPATSSAPAERRTAPRPPIVLSHADRRWTVVPDESTLAADLEGLARQIDRPAVDARLAIRPDLTVELSSSQPGLRLDVGATAARLRPALLAGNGSEGDGAGKESRGPVEIALVVREVPPTTTEADLAEARAGLERALSGPMTLKLEARTWTLDRRDFAPALSVVQGENPGEKWRVRVDEGLVSKLVARLAPEIDQPVLDARFGWSGGKLAVIRESKAGRRLDVVQTVASLKERLSASDRTVPLVVVPVAPAVETGLKDRLGIKELVETARTSFAGAIPQKQHNIKLAASRLNGTVVPPGATFSFNREVGPTVLAAGFQWGFGIVDGDEGLKTVPSVAGGICQVSTTLFQAVFWAGYQVEERNWHLYWIPAYTSRGVVGLDSTVDEEAGLDFRFTNTTPSHVLVQAGVEGSAVWFSLYGTKPTWRVEVEKPVVTSVVPPDPQLVTEEDPTMPYGQRVQIEAAREGFDVAIVRRVHEEGHVGNAESGPGKLRTLRIKSVYRPSRNVILVGTKGKPAGAAPVGATPSPAPSGSATPAPKTTPGPGTAPPPGVAPAVTPTPAARPTR